MVMHSGLLREGAKVRPGIVKAKSGSKVSFDLRPEQDPFPHFQFATPARYHSPTQNFAIGDLVWYEIQGNFNISSKGIQWGEATIVEVYGEEQSARYYRLAGKSWSYDHFVHPLIGDSDGPPAFRNLSIDASRAMIKQWTISNHDNSYVRGMAMQNKDQVLHPALSRVPRTALFKVWDRSTMPPIPFPLSALTVDGKNPSSRQRQATYTLQDAQSKYGTDLQFKGSKQNNYGPGHWGITMEQLRAVQEMDGFESSMTMYDVVSKLLKPMTKGSGMGYALYLNKEKPLVAKQMVSHAWGEQYTHFVQALEGSRCEGPFWICATAIDQENSERIADQLGPSLEHGPFATVLKQVTDMICVFTPAVDIYLRMWCVFEIYVAVKYGVNVVVSLIACVSILKEGLNLLISPVAHQVCCLESASPVGN